MSHPQPVRQDQGQAGIADLALRPLHVVGNAPAVHYASIRIVNRERRARVAIARLSHRPGVDEVSALRLDSHVLAPYAGQRRWDGLDPRAVPDIATLHV